MKINLNTFIGTVATEYAEVVKSQKFVQVENFSLDFMIQTKSSWDDFRQGIILFRETLLSNKWVDLKQIKLFVSSMLHHRRMINLVSLAKPVDFKTSESARFFDNNELNDWMIEEINKNLKNNIAVEIYPGIVLVKKNDGLVVVCSKKFMEG